MNEKYTQLVNRQTLDSRYNKLKEELFELGQAVCHYQEDKIGIEEFYSEMADVMILMEHIYMLQNERELLESCLEYKRNRWVERSGK